MDIETLGMIGAVALFGAGLALKYYKKIKPALDEALEDGQLTLEEAMSLADDAKEIVEEVKSLPSFSKMKRMRKSEILNLCAEHGIDAKGTKDELIAKLKEQVK